ncbi:MAG TPA: OmpA family protein [Pseudomonas sp.]|nr:OmpA family protein [Pseudomonas sp.]
MCVALVGYADMSDSYASAKDGLQPAGGGEKVARAEANAAKSEPSAKAAGKKVEPAATKPSEKKREATAAHKVEKKSASGVAHKAEKKPASTAAAHKADAKPAAAASSPLDKKAEPAAAAEKPAAPSAAPAGASKPEPVADKQPEAVQADSKNRHWWWPFGGSDKAAEQKAAQAQAQAQARAAVAAAPAPAAVKAPEPKPVSKAWLDDNEKRLKAAVAGSKFEVERRGDLLVVVAPVESSFNRDRPNMLLPATLGPLSKMAKQVEGDAQSAILVLGHGDGNAEPDRKLTQERAQAVASIFRMSGLKSDRLMLRGMGADKPRASNDNAKGREQNRRVEIILTQRDSLPALMAQNSR